MKSRVIALIGLLTGAAAVALFAQVQDARQANLAAAQGRSAQPVPQAGAIASTLATWRALQQTDALPFDSYASFLLQHPGWPSETANRRAAERQAGNAPSAASVVAFFRTYPPRSATGAVAYARALQTGGRRDEANAAARDAWRRGTLSPEDEAVVLTQFSGALTPADHDARMDMLLWQGATATAARQLSLTSPGARALFEARLAFHTNAANAADYAAGNDAAGATNPGYVADKASWLRNNGTSPSARSWLARSRTLSSRPSDVEKYYEVLLTNARGAAADSQWQTAYDIARQIDDAYPPGHDISKEPYGERDDYTSLAWLAGQVAFKELGRPADAMAMYDRYGRAAQSPQVRAKGFYWAGRAAEAAGRASEAKAFLERAAGYRDQYYGQLSNEHLGRTLMAPPGTADRTVDPSIRAAFYMRETVRAAQFLGSIGDWQDQTAFVKQIATNATTDDDHVLAKELSRSLGRPDLGVLVGRSALLNGLTDYSAAGFPIVPVPSGYEDQFTMIHAITRQESQFDREAISSAGARGFMQLMPGTAREQAGKLGLSYDRDALTRDTNYNVQLGSSYFQRIFGIYGSYPLAIAAYNAGPGNVNKWLRANGDPRTGAVDMVDWIEAIPYSETRNYVQRVLENAVVYDLIQPARARSRGPANLSWYLGRSRKG